MKYVNVNGYYTLVSNDATGFQIKAAFVHQHAPNHAPASGLQLQSHNANGSNTVIGDDETPWQHDFSAISIFDNA